MGKILMIYASQSGNTEMITDIIADDLRALNQQVVIKSFDFDLIDMEALVEYDAVLIGTYTWDDGELPYEVEGFYIDIAEVDIKGVTFGVYGSADSCYDTYGLAIDLLADRINNQGGSVIEERLKIDLLPNKHDEQRCEKFAGKIVKEIATGNITTVLS